jgi:ubiquinone/menaquinone biosynthesis C-methylase UbiE
LRKLATFDHSWASLERRDTVPEEFDEEYYDAFERVEDAFQLALDLSLEPRGPEVLYDIVSGLSLSPGASVIDVGCGEGRHALTLAERFGFKVRGLDPIRRHIQLANDHLAAATERVPGLDERVRFEIGVAEDLRVEDASIDLVWCRDVLVLVAAIERAYSEFRRVLVDEGHVLVYQSSFATEKLDRREAESLSNLGIVQTSADPARTEAAIAAAGLRIDQQMEVGIEWAEWSEEQSGTKSRRLLHAARLLRNPERYIEQFGQPAYDIMLADCFWHIYHLIGKLGARVYLLSRR